MGQGFLKCCPSFLWFLCLFLLLAGCSKDNQSKDEPKVSIRIGDVGALISNMSTIDEREQADIQRIIANGNASTKAQSSIARIIVLHGKVGEPLHTSPVAVSVPVLDEFMKAALAHDSDGMAQMLMNDLVFVVNDWVQVRVIDHGGNICRIRVVDGPMRGRAGYVPDKWIKPIQSSSK